MADTLIFPSCCSLLFFAKEKEGITIALSYGELMRLLVFFKDVCNFLSILGPSPTRLEKGAAGWGRKKKKREGLPM